MNIGIVCYASVGGSGIIATELGKTLAARGHGVHILSSDTPFRLGDYQPGLSFHRVETPSYPLFREPQYLLSLANKIVQVARDERLDIIHAHYAIPHATAAYLARQILASPPRRRRAARHHDAARHRHHAARQRSVVLGNRRVLHRAVRRRHRGVGEPQGRHLARARRRRATSASFRISSTARCIAGVDVPDLRAAASRRTDEKLVIHVSNFRPVKRVAAVVEVFAPDPQRGAGAAADGRRRPGPGRGGAAGARARASTDDVQFLGEQDQVLPLLSVSDVFLLPSAQESFGLAALEAMACEVPVVASRVGGLPEVIEHGVTGFLHPPDDLDGMARSAVRLLTDERAARRVAGAARRAVHERFCDEKIVPIYEAYYEEILKSGR